MTLSYLFVSMSVDRWSVRDLKDEPRQRRQFIKPENGVRFLLFHMCNYPYGFAYYLFTYICIYLYIYIYICVYLNTSNSQNSHFIYLSSLHRVNERSDILPVVG